MTEKRTRPRTRSILLIAFLIAGVIFASLLLDKYMERRRHTPLPAQTRPDQTVLVSLFFASPGGEGLVRETREIDSCSDDVPTCIRASIEELANGPLGDLTPTLPDTAAPRGVRVLGDTAFIDFGEELKVGLPGGSSAEMAAVYSVVDTVAFNFPQIRKVKFLIEGKDVATLKGHLDLRQPIEPDYQLEKKNQED